MNSTPTTPLEVFGPAPYRFLGLETTEDRQALNSHRRSEGLTYTTNMCGGSCDLCGQAIFNVFRFEAANGKRFKLGCDCALKAGDKHIAKQVQKAEKAREKSKRETAKTNKADRDALRIWTMWARVDEVAEKLALVPHPARIPELTLLDWCRYVMANGGTSGRLRVAALIEEALSF